MKEPKLVSCLTATFGRLSKLKEAVSCFVLQDYPNKELVILNNHPQPLTCDLPQVRVINEPGHPNLGSCRNRLLQLASGDFVRTWDDDDLYLPWTLSQGVENIGSSAAFKPLFNWFDEKGKPLKLVENAMEAAMLVRVDVAKKYGYQLTGGDEHIPLLNGIDREGGCKLLDMGALASYAYRWGYGMWHISGSLGNGTVAERTGTWLKHNQDVGDGKITQVDMTPTWRYILSQVKAQFQAIEYTLMKNQFERSLNATIAD